MPQLAKENHGKDYDHVIHLEIGRVSPDTLEGVRQAFGHRAGCHLFPWASDSDPGSDLLPGVGKKW